MMAHTCSSNIGWLGEEGWEFEANMGYKLRPSFPKGKGRGYGSWWEGFTIAWHSLAESELDLGGHLVFYRGRGRREQPRWLEPEKAGSSLTQVYFSRPNIVYPLSTHNRDWYIVDRQHGWMNKKLCGYTTSSEAPFLCPRQIWDSKLDPVSPLPFLSIRGDKLEEGEGVGLSCRDQCPYLVFVSGLKEP